MPRRRRFKFAELVPDPFVYHYHLYNKNVQTTQANFVEVPVL